MTSHRVLLVLNIQVGLIADPPQGIPAARLVRENVATVLEQARCASHPPRIIHCRSCGDPGDIDEKGTQTWELLHAPRSGEFVVDCRKTNAFMGTALGELIAPDAELVVVGLMSEYAVKSTCRAALRRGNTVLLMRGAHGTHDHTVIADGGRFTPGENISARVEEELDRAGAMILDMKYLSGLFEGR
ncbi:Isochorismatase-like protein [Mycena albidolilacea]|uniref:Isochorismatase-like protein n=1 Tax=Mycena albidolilacea TaxID=1033008 RepID=A0AAD7EEV1_9AGAR|nr:Isochorismatase-like protein [Mycena albidolilacea]